MWDNIKYINLESLEKICKGDSSRFIRYLKQFSAMIPLSMEKLKQALNEENRDLIFKEIHFMSPHLVFFGIHDFAEIMKDNFEFLNLSTKELHRYLQKPLLKIQNAILEVDQLIEHELKNKQNED